MKKLGQEWSKAARGDVDTDTIEEPFITLSEHDLETIAGGLDSYDSSPDANGVEQGGFGTA